MVIVTILRSSVRAHVVINHARTNILSCAPCGLQNAIEGQGKNLATRGTAIGLVSLWWLLKRHAYTKIVTAYQCSPQAKFKA